MKKFKLTKQRIIFGGNEKITENNRTKSYEISADEFKKITDKISIIEENLEFAKKYLNKDYKIGDIHESPVKSISFSINDIEIRNINILADPYYKLEEFIDGEWKIIDKHKCKYH